MIPHITVGKVKQDRAKAIANSFGEFYSTLGESLVKKIVPGTMSVNEYLWNIPSQ